MNKYYSQCAQDEFVNRILNQPTSGFFIDIGASHPTENSNSYFFESVGWNGLCFDHYDMPVFDQIRKSKMILGDATQHDYNRLFIERSVPTVVEYLSIDVDESTLKVLQKIPLQPYRYKVITIEHDWYRFGDTLRSEERRILNEAGYYLLCSDVDGTGEGKIIFEDWWINPEFVNVDAVQHLKCDRVYFDTIIKKF